MTRFFPTAWTAAHVAITTLATWALCATDALSGLSPVFFH